MAQVSMTARMDDSLKSSLDALGSQIGMSANTAKNVFAMAVVQRGKIPFEIRGDKTESTSDGLKAFKELRAMAESGRFPEMTLDEITLTRD